MSHLVFLSSNEADAEFLAGLRRHLNTVGARGLVSWHPDDEVGRLQREVLPRAAVVVLLVSSHFLDAEFRDDAELPRSLGSAGKPVFWVPVDWCAWDLTDISGFQALHSANRPLSSLTRDERERALLNIARRIDDFVHKHVSPPPPDPPGPGAGARGRGLSSLSGLSEAHKRTLQELTVAIDRRNALREQGDDTTAADVEVRRLRREMRRGLPLRVGDTLEGSRYILREELVAGGAIRVWLAHDSLRDVLVVVKVLTGDAMHDRFTHAAGCAARLLHDAIVPLLAPAQEDLDHHYFVMRHIRGWSLSRAVKEGRVGSAQSLAIIRRIGEALVYAHAQSVLHCNLEPDNVLIDEGTKAYLIDFDPVRDEEVAGEGHRRGAHVYAAPEIDTLQNIDRRTDVYGLGMLALFMLHGKPLTRDATRPELGFIDGLPAPAPIRAALKKATAWRPEDRYPDVQAFIDDLVKADAPSPTPAQPPVLLPTPKPAPIPEPAPTLKPDGITAPPSGWNSGLAWVAGGGALVSVLLVLAYIIESQPTGVPPVIDTVGSSGSTGSLAQVTAASTGPVLDASNSSGAEERDSTGGDAATGQQPLPEQKKTEQQKTKQQKTEQQKTEQQRRREAIDLVKKAGQSCVKKNLDAHDPEAEFKVSYTIDGASGTIELKTGSLATLYPRTFTCIDKELRTVKVEDVPKFRGPAEVIITFP